MALTHLWQIDIYCCKLTGYHTAQSDYHYLQCIEYSKCWSILRKVHMQILKLIFGS